MEEKIAVSGSAILTQCLIDRLKVAMLGESFIYRQKWAQKATPDGRAYWAHMGSASFLTGRGESSESIRGGWATPAARDYRSGQAKRAVERRHAININDQVMLIKGKLVGESIVDMAIDGNLNPAFSAWAQGYPRTWCKSAILADRSGRISGKVPSKK